MSRSESRGEVSIAVIIPVYNCACLLRQTLEGIREGSLQPQELLVVDDASTDDSGLVAEAMGARLLRMRSNRGPAACRNAGALEARSDVLVFLDADTRVHTDTLQLMVRQLSADPDLSAVIGAYDEVASDAGACSQYRNLAHRYVHCTSARRALTFWSGCGAVRRSAFFAASGFDERYRRPSVEDIELGYRITDGGARILLDPEIQVNHLKRWTVMGGMRTDVVDRGVPWMILLLERRWMPNDLNLTIVNRLSVVAAVGMVMSVLASAESRMFLVAAGLFAMLALGLHAGLFRFLYRKKGAGFLPAAAFFCLAQEMCNIVSTVGGLVLWGVGTHRNPRRSSLMASKAAEQTAGVNVRSA